MIIILPNATYKSKRYCTKVEMKENNYVESKLKGV